MRNAFEKGLLGDGGGSETVVWAISPLASFFSGSGLRSAGSLHRRNASWDAALAKSESRRGSLHATAQARLFRIQKTMIHVIYIYRYTHVYHMCVYIYVICTYVPMYIYIYVYITHIHICYCLELVPLSGWFRYTNRKPKPIWGYYYFDK